MRRLAIYVLILACATSPTAFAGKGPDGGADPPRARNVGIMTSLGWIQATDGECSNVDWSKLIESIESGADQVRHYLPGSDSFEKNRRPTVIGRRKLFAGLIHALEQGKRPDGAYDPIENIIYFRCGKEAIVVHEMQHAACYVFGLTVSCDTVDHPGGVELDGSPVVDAYR